MTPSFAQTTGRGVRIAVIDSGVHPAHPHIDAARLTGGVAITREGAIEAEPQAMLDRLGHGTAVTAAIQQGAPGADIMTVRVFRDALRASAMALLAAIDWSIEAGADIVNLSLGSMNPAHEQAFARAADRAAAAGVLLVSAHSVDDTPCWPGALPSVLGVDLDWDCPRGNCRMAWGDRAPIFAATGYPRAIDGVPPARNLHGVSFAVAQMTGLAARACEAVRAERPGVDIAAEIPRFLSHIAMP